MFIQLARTSVCNYLVPGVPSVPPEARQIKGKIMGIIQLTCHRGFRQQKVVRWCFPRNTRNTRKRSASRLSPADAPQVPGSPGGPVHAGEDAGRAADGGVPRARRPKGNLSSRRWRGTRSCEAWWLHRPNQVPFVSFVCFAGNGFRQVNCIIPFVKVAISN